MIHVVNADLFSLDVDAVVNPVNTQGHMGAGLAAVFKAAFPEMDRQYRFLCAQGKFRIGSLYVYRPPQDYKYIINFPTKSHWRHPSKLDYIDRGLYKLKSCIYDKQITSIAIPALGCGLGGLNWTDVYQLIQLHLGSIIECYIYVCEPKL